jgi:quercetin dioxygenase-like cupin family protein
MKGSKLIKKGASEYERKIAGKKYKYLIKTEQLGGILVEIEPGADSEFYEHEGEEIKIVIKGEIEYTVGKKVYRLKEGDVLWHQSSIPHRIKNSGDKKAICFTVDTPPTFT